MTRILVPLFLLVCTHSPALAQRGPVGIGVDVHGAYVSVMPAGFEDASPGEPGIAYGWINDVSNGMYFEGRLSIRLPFGVRPYVGYHIGRPRERAPTMELWSQIYQALPDFEAVWFTEEGHDVDYRTQGWNTGLIYEPDWLQWTISPYLIGEIRTESLRARTQLQGVVDDVQAPAARYTISGAFNGNSLMETEITYGYGIGLGLHIPMQHLGFSAPFGMLSLVPEVKYVSAPGAQIQYREYEWTVDVTDGPIARTTVDGRLDVLDGQTIDHRYIAFRIGLRYEPF